MSDSEDSRPDGDLDTAPDTTPDIAAEAAAPLETDPADWQEQQLVVPDPDPDERR